MILEGFLWGTGFILSGWMFLFFAWIGLKVTERYQDSQMYRTRVERRELKRIRAWRRRQNKQRREQHETDPR